MVNKRTHGGHPTRTHWILLASQEMVKQAVVSWGTPDIMILDRYPEERPDTAFRGWMPVVLRLWIVDFHANRESSGVKARNPSPYWSSECASQSVSP